MLCFNKILKRNLYNMFAWLGHVYLEVFIIVCKKSLTDAFNFRFKYSIMANCFLSCVASKNGYISDNDYNNNRIKTAKKLNEKEKKKIEKYFKLKSKKIDYELRKNARFYQNKIKLLLLSSGKSSRCILNVQTVFNSIVLKLICILILKTFLEIKMKHHAIMKTLNVHLEVVNHVLWIAIQMIVKM